MLRICFAGILLLTGVCLWEAATADAQEQRIEGWGQVINPLGDCRAALRSSTLSITVPGKYHDLVALPNLKDTNAPRVVQEVDGDFVLQARIRRFAVPQPKSAVNKENAFSYVSSGLLIWQDQDNFLRLQRAANGDSGNVNIHANQFADGNAIANSNTKIADEDVHLRVERKSNKFTLAFSLDGATWTTVVPKGKELVLQSKVKVGVFVINATNREIIHDFSDLKLSTSARAPAPRPGTNSTAASKDQQLIQGTWECTQTLKDGESVQDFVGVRAIMEGNRLTRIFTTPDGTQAPDYGTFKLDASQQPKHFDWSYDKKPDYVHKRLYILDGDTLKWSDNRTGERPRTFAEGKWQFTMKRVRE